MTNDNDDCVNLHLLYLNTYAHMYCIFEKIVTLRISRFITDVTIA